MSFLAKGTPLLPGRISTDDSSGKEYLINNILWLIEMHRCSGCYHGTLGTEAVQPACVKRNRAVPSPAFHMTLCTWKNCLYKDMANSFLAFCATRCVYCLQVGCSDFPESEPQDICWRTKGRRTSACNWW